MENLNKKDGITFVFSTHDPRVMKRARRIITLVVGEIEQEN
jgi:putative ABC transport system ATP-binding protein